jgi:DNA-directed RNA polymerase specialized sigma24 family protein
VEVARSSGEPPDRVRQRKHRALERLRELLAEDA